MLLVTCICCHTTQKIVYMILQQEAVEWIQLVSVAAYCGAVLPCPAGDGHGQG